MNKCKINQALSQPNWVRFVSVSKQGLGPCETALLILCLFALAQTLLMLKQTQKICSSYMLTHWGRVTHVCVGKLTIIGSDNGLSPERHQAIIWTNAGILLIRPLGTNSSEILIEIHTFSFKNIHLKMSSARFRPFCLGLNALNVSIAIITRYKIESQQDIDRN